MNCKLPAVNISGLALSDLFFNCELKDYNALDRRSFADMESMRKAEKAALLEDAIAFCLHAGLDAQVEIKGEPLADLLVEDFLARV